MSTPQTESESRILHFSVDGEWLTDTARNRILEKAWDHGVKLLMTLDGMTYDQAFQILKGTHKLVSTEEGTLDFKEEDRDISGFLDTLKFQTAGICRLGDEFWRPYAFVDNWGREDAISAGDMPAMNSHARKEWGRKRSMHYADSPKDKVFEIDDPMISVLFKKIDRQPLWIEFTRDPKEAYKQFVDVRALEHRGYQQWYPDPPPSELKTFFKKSKKKTQVQETIQKMKEDAAEIMGTSVQELFHPQTPLTIEAAATWTKPPKMPNWSLGGWIIQPDGTTYNLLRQFWHGAVMALLYPEFAREKGFELPKLVEDLHPQVFQTLELDHGRELPVIRVCATRMITTPLSVSWGDRPATEAQIDALRLLFLSLKKKANDIVSTNNRDMKIKDLFQVIRKGEDVWKHQLSR